MSREDLFSNDEMLMLGIKNQDPAALHYVYKNYFRMIKDFVLKNSGIPDDAKDVFQDGVISLRETIMNKELVLTCPLKQYFRAICRNNWLKKLKDRNKFIKIDDIGYEITDIPEDNFDSEIKIEELNIHFAELGEKCQEILRSFYYSRLRMEAIAIKLKYTNAANVKSQKHKCIEQLKRKIKNVK